MGGNNTRIRSARRRSRTRQQSRRTRRLRGLPSSASLSTQTQENKNTKEKQHNQGSEYLIDPPHNHRNHSPGLQPKLPMSKIPQNPLNSPPMRRDTNINTPLRPPQFVQHTPDSNRLLRLRLLIYRTPQLILFPESTFKSEIGVCSLEIRFGTALVTGM